MSIGNDRLDLIESLRWKKFPVLDAGFICLVDVMGSDEAICEAARNSYGKGTRSISDDRTLLRYMLRHGHTTPFEMAELKFQIRVPMDAWRQWARHRTATICEYSTRYSEAITDKCRAGTTGWRAQSQTNKQGSSSDPLAWPANYGVYPVDEGGGLYPREIAQAADDHRHWAVVRLVDDHPQEILEYFDGVTRDEVTPERYLAVREGAFQGMATECYDERLAFGVAREQARKDLPLSTYTQAYWKIDLHNLLHFLHLRMDSHAQQEIREYAEIIGREIVQPLFPQVWEAFEDFDLQAMSLSRLDREVVVRMTQLASQELADEMATAAPTREEMLSYLPPYPLAVFEACQEEYWGALERCRERDECLAKLRRLGLVRAEGDDGS